MAAEDADLDATLAALEIDETGLPPTAEETDFEATDAREEAEEAPTLAAEDADLDATLAALERELTGLPPTAGRCRFGGYRSERRCGRSS